MKIFGIGLSRTGTTSLTQALRALGYKAAHCPRSLALIDRMDASTDTPVARHYKMLDKTYPNSRFILTIRDFPTWLQSCSKFFRSRPSLPNNEFRDEVNQTLYGGREFDEQRFTDAYNNHMADVQTYFADRQKDLLTLDICGGDEWEPLCTFLNKDIPQRVFPWRNRS